MKFTQGLRTSSRQNLGAFAKVPELSKAGHWAGGEEPLRLSLPQVLLSSEGSGELSTGGTKALLKSSQLRSST